MTYESMVAAHPAICSRVYLSQNWRRQCVPCTVTIEKDGKKADARKMFALMGLGIKSGDTVTVHVGGENEEQVAADLEAFMQENL